MSTTERPKQRKSECAERKTRGSTGTDGGHLLPLPPPFPTFLKAIAILAIINSAKGSFHRLTVLAEQFRPAIGKYIVGDSTRSKAIYQTGD